jgi:hypothetical protein
MKITCSTKKMKTFDVLEMKMVIECKKKKTKMVKPTLSLDESKVIYP